MDGGFTEKKKNTSCQELYYYILIICFDILFKFVISYKKLTCLTLTIYEVHLTFQTLYYNDHLPMAEIVCQYIPSFVN